MELTGISYALVMLILTLSTASEVKARVESFVYSPTSQCAGMHVCPDECPSLSSKDPKEKVCFAHCNSPICRTHCRNRTPNCNGLGAACYDPRFIGGDGVVFYFHGKKNENFSLVSDTTLQINGRFIGHRPTGCTRDNAWIQALGILFKSHSFSLEATMAASWNNEVDHLKFTYDEKELVLPEGSLSLWYSPDKDIKMERISAKNSVLVTLKDMAEIMVSVVPITKEDDRIHKYQLPLDDCFAHFEVQFNFLGLSPNVEGVLGRTYRADFENPAKPGVAMPVVGGENTYKTTSLLAADCKLCVFSPGNVSNQEGPIAIKNGTLDCTSHVASSSGYGIFCKK